MGMDPRLMGFLDPRTGAQFFPQFCSLASDPTFVSGPRFGRSYLDQNFRDFDFNVPVIPASANLQPPLNVIHEGDYPEDCDFSDEVLSYINKMLMEEDMEDQTCMLQESLDLQAAEKSFYEVLGKKYPPSPEPNSAYSSHGYSNNSRSPEDSCCTNYSSCISDGSFYNSDVANGTLVQRKAEYTSSLSHSGLFSRVYNSSYSSSSGVLNGLEHLNGSSSSALYVPGSCPETQSVWQFHKGIEEASKFLPSNNQLLINVDVKGPPALPKPKADETGVKLEKKDGEFSPGGSKGRKASHREDGDVEEERNAKQAAVCEEAPLRSEMFDKLLLYSNGEGLSHLKNVRETLQSGASKNMQQNEKQKGSNGGKDRNKKQGGKGKREVIDLRTLLVTCAQAVAADDRRSAYELLKQIRQHSSPFGDGNQRLAHCFADGLEARLAGTGSQIYKGLISKKRSAADLLKAYHLYLAASPFLRISNFTANKTILNLAEKASRIHVIDFGILYGFQWPTLIQRFHMKYGESRKLRITGIDLPQPGFRPAERVEEAGRRLKAYAENFKVPFEYNSIAKSWESIQVEDLKIDRDELLVVNCSFRFKNLSDETVIEESPRDIVLNLIRRIKPDIFLHRVVNGAYSAPFFVTRFREALFHFSSLFDMLETIVPREDPERLLIEREVIGREALNVIACEGWERVERPETYKQWQVRNLRAGFIQLPFDRPVVEKAISHVKDRYQKDFLIDEDGKWLLQGWKGRIIYALSLWKPV